MKYSLDITYSYYGRSYAGALPEHFAQVVHRVPAHHGFPAKSKFDYTAAEKIAIDDCIKCKRAFHRVEYYALWVENNECEY